MTMWEPVTLCCFTRRTGCLALGFLELIGVLFTLFFGAFLLMDSEMGPLKLECRKTLPSMRESCEQVLLGVKIFIAIAMINAVVQLVVASMMIYGVRKNSHCLMVPFLIKNAIVMVLAIIFGGLGLVLLCIYNVVLGIVTAYMFGALIFMWTYILLTVRAYYYELKSGRAADHHQLDEKRVTADGGAQ